MIDPLAAAISLVSRDAEVRDLVGDRVAAKHKFGMSAASSSAWTTPCKALQLQLEASQSPDIDTPIHRIGLEARCYGESQAEAMRVYLALLRMVRGFERTTTPTGGGEALIYSLVLDSSPVPLTDPDMDDIDYILVYLRATVAEGVAATT